VKRTGSRLAPAPADDWGLTFRDTRREDDDKDGISNAFDRCRAKPEDSTCVSPGTERQLKAVAERLRVLPGTSLEVTGRAGERASGRAGERRTKAGNELLARLRAEAVRKAMEREGISDARVIRLTAPEAKQTDRSRTPDGEAVARKAELKLLQAPAAPQ
jgi:hypothetical protein